MVLNSGNNPHNKSKSNDSKVNFIKSNKPFLNYSMLAGMVVFVAISAAVIYRSFASVSVKFPTQSNRVLVELQDGHNDGPASDTLKPAETVNFRLYGNGLAVCGNNETGQYTSQKLDKKALNIFMANFKMAGFDKINDDLPNNTPFTTAESSTIKVISPTIFVKLAIHVIV